MRPTCDSARPPANKAARAPPAVSYARSFAHRPCGWAAHLSALIYWRLLAFHRLRWLRSHGDGYPHLTLGHRDIPTTDARLEHFPRHGGFEVLVRPLRSDHPSEATLPAGKALLRSVGCRPTAAVQNSPFACHLHDALVLLRHRVVLHICSGAVPWRQWVGGHLVGPSARDAFST
eukprot:COSAG05_NODE_2677_length_2775_cov_27.104634_3_plen_175_part_00